MAYTKYSLTPANNNAAPPDGAPEGMLPSAVNDTMRDMMAQIRDVGDGIRGGTYTMTAPVITGGSVTGSTINNSAIGGTTAAAGKFTTLEATGVTTVQAGTVSAPAITTTGDTNTGIFFPAADTIAFTEGGTESMRIDSSGNVGIGTTAGSGIRLAVSGGQSHFSNDVYLTRNDASGPFFGSLSSVPLRLGTGDTEQMRITSAGNVGIGASSPDIFGRGYNRILGISSATGNGAIELNSATGNGSFIDMGVNAVRLFTIYSDTTSSGLNTNTALPLYFATNSAERMRIDSSGNVLIGKTSATGSIAGVQIESIGVGAFTSSGNAPVYVNRLTSDGTLVSLRQATTEEGTISVSGTTVSYNGGHLSRWSQLPDGSKDDAILKGTVLTNLDAMCVWEKDGVVADNEQLNKMKVSNVEGDTNVAGVFVNWTKDEDYNSDDMNIAMTGDMIIRIADGVVVQKGDLLMSAGDGTAKPQGDDIVRSKTIAKVTSNYVTCTYADGSYCVPCVLMAC